MITEPKWMPEALKSLDLVHVEIEGMKGEGHLGMYKDNALLDSKKLTNGKFLGA